MSVSLWWKWRCFKPLCLHAHNSSYWETAGDMFMCIIQLVLIRTAVWKGQTTKLSRFQTRTWGLSFSRHYPEELYVRTQMFESVLFRLVQKCVCWVSTAGNWLEVSQWASGCVFLSHNWRCLGVLLTKHWCPQHYFFISYYAFCLLCSHRTSFSLNPVLYFQKHVHNVSRGPQLSSRN